jgi:pimeloyl-ACP methyl ester carboxylesterase
MHLNPLQALANTLLMSAILSSSAASATTAEKSNASNFPVVNTGTLAGAPYRIDVPAGWNGELVMYLHGYEPPGFPRQIEISQTDFDRWLLAKGYAVAQSQYAAPGWAVAEAMADNERLRLKVIAEIGKPNRTYLIGQSLGGHLALASLERQPESYDGALVLCGANSPASEIFADGALAPLAAFEVFFPGRLGLAAGGLSNPNAPPMVDPNAVEAALQSNEASAKVLADRFDLLREDLAGALLMRYVVLREMMVRAGGFPVDNRNTKYTGFGDDAAFNAQVRRYPGDAKAIAYTAAHAPLSGLAAKPVVVLSNINDPTIPANISGRYAELARENGNAVNVHTLPSSGKGHCAFTPDDIDAAFRVLTQWVNTGKSPN